MFNLPFFEGVPSELIAEIQAKSVEKEVMANNFICKEGEAGSEMYIVLEGSLDVYKQIGGNPAQVNTLGAGEFFCETSLITHAPRNASIITTKTTRLLVITKEDFDKVFGKYPEISEKISKAIVDHADSNTLKEIQIKREKMRKDNPDESNEKPLTISI